MALKFTSANFDTEVLQSATPVLVDFYADWCGPCKMMAPVVDALAQEMPGVKIGKLNVDDNGDIAGNYRVMTIPTMIVFKDGKEVNRVVGVQNKSALVDLLNAAQ